MFAACSANLNANGQANGALTCDKIVDYNQSTATNNSQFLVMKGAVVRNLLVAVYMDLGSLNATNFNSTIGIFDTSGISLVQWQAQQQLITSAAIFIQEDNVLIYYTAKPSAQGGNPSYGESLYFISFSVTNVPQTFQPLYVEVLNANKICAFQMVGYPFLSGGSYQLAIASSCGTSGLTSVYHIRFNF